jgi:hypothetical protein
MLRSLEDGLASELLSLDPDMFLAAVGAEETILLGRVIYRACEYTDGVGVYRRLFGFLDNIDA